jgi:hypothetical protein
MNNSLFEKKTRLSEEECDINSREMNNNEMFNYRTFNNIQTNKNNAKDCLDNYNKISEFSFENFMNIKDGHGFTNACLVDNDSEIRNNFKVTSERAKQQLFSRTFVGGPNLNKGGFEAEMDAKLTQGFTNSKKHNCTILAEASYERFEPMNNCMLSNLQSTKTIIPAWKWGGEGTRDVLSQRDFLENNGYSFNGKIWQKGCDQK